MSGVLNKVFISIISSSIDTQNTPKETTKLALYVYTMCMTNLYRVMS